MPRIAVSLGVLATLAFCIGFNTVRYPAVWEMLNQPGLALAASQPTDAAAPAASSVKPPLAAAKPAQSAGSASKTAAHAKIGSTAANQADSEPEFCTADGVCQIGAGPRPTTKKGPTPAQKSGSDRSASLPGLPRDAALDGLNGQSAESGVRSPEAAERGPDAAVAKQEPPRAAEDGDSRPTDPRLRPPASGVQAAAKVARVERPLVPVPDGPPASRLLPLPPVDESAGAGAGPAVASPSGASTPLYPTTGYPAVDLGRLRSRESGRLAPVSQAGS